MKHYFLCTFQHVYYTNLYIIFSLASFELKFAQHQPLAELPPLEQSVEQVQTPEQWISGTQWVRAF